MLLLLFVVVIMVDISMLVITFASDFAGYDRRRLALAL
jgi:hypothetical protein